ncbi:MAG TPA: cation diffusion facilitator family transporter [Smithellaceae bacterium]|nr:cation diffusion facilitator family transporter [Smithellaceae bacterium]HRS90337.1 cation diffusion facilitator family transporter [Smithellaceae bacterium]HRV27125.1 cation diffusion facilitator family transporter [Smithellaceae bacterium]
MKQELKIRLAYIEGWFSIFINTVLFALKYWAGVVTGSVAIIADAWHTLSDSLTSILVIVGAKISRKPADKEHPFGHGRAELIAAVIIGGLLAAVAVNFFAEALMKLKNREAASYNIFAVVIFSLSVIFKEGLAQFSGWAAKKTGMLSLKADAWHHRSDAIASAVILAAIFAGKYFWWIDAVMGMAVSVLILHAAYRIIKESSDQILGTEPEENIKQQIMEIINEKTGQSYDAHHFHMHRYGSHVELTFHIRVPGSIPIKEAYDLTVSMAKEIKARTDIDTTIGLNYKKE